MSGICSRHYWHDPNCNMCTADIRDVLPDYDRKVHEAELAGIVTCGACSFKFYRTVDSCPKCCEWVWLDGGYRVTWPFHTRGHQGYGQQDWIGI